MAGDRPLVAASILNADFGNLSRVVRKLEKAGADRFHLDVMDGHFVPNLSFGPDIVAAIRRLTRLPLDLHLMISEPARYVDRFLRAGGDSVTFHVEVQESEFQRRATLETIRAAGRRAGLAISPATPVEAVQPYLDLLDMVIVMTVEPGFGGQHFMRDRAPKIAQARALLADREGREVHVDGGISHETAGIAGRYGGDVLVVGSALFQRGHDAAREVQLVHDAVRAALAEDTGEAGAAAGGPARLATPR